MGTSLVRKFPDPVKAIMRVGSEHVCSVLRKREGFADKFQRGRGVGGKDHRVFRRGAKECEYAFTSLSHTIGAELGTVPDLLDGDDWKSYRNAYLLLTE